VMTDLKTFPSNGFRRPLNRTLIDFAVERHKAPGQTRKNERNMRNDHARPWHRVKLFQCAPSLIKFDSVSQTKIEHSPSDFVPTSIH